MQKHIWLQRETKLDKLVSVSHVVTRARDAATLGVAGAPEAGGLPLRGSRA